MTEKLQKIIYSAIVLIYIVLINKVPVSIYSNAIHDDALFISRAQDIVAGNWAGSVYNQFILAKGLGFSLFEAFNYYLGLPITLTIGLVNIAMAFFLKNTIEKFYKNEYFSMLFFIFILFTPVLIPQRIIRDNIYISLATICAVGFIRLLLKIDNNKILATFYGFIFGLFWITREEGLWIFPALILSIFIIYKKYGKKYFLDLYKNLFLFLVSGFLVIFLISGFNWYKYGLFGTNDFKEANFTSAINAIYSVRAGDPIPYLPASKEKREIIYKVSPTFSLLKSYFDGEGMGWTVFGCEIYPQTCGDYASGWFMWALRDAAYTQGAYSSPSSAKNFYKSIAVEINRACSSDSIKCDSPAIPFLPPMRSDQWNLFPSSLLDGFKKLMYFGGMEIISESSGPIFKISEYTSFLGRPLIAQKEHEDLVYVSGWVKAKNNQWFSLDCLNSDGRKTFIPKRSKSPDILQDGLGQKDVRFSFNVNKNDECYLIMDNGGGRLNINENINSPGMKKIGNNVFQFDNFDLPKVKNNKIFQIQFLFKIYKYISPTLIFIGLLCFIYNIFSKNKYFESLLIIEIYTWTLVISRLFLLSLIEISSFQAINYQYLGPIYILIALAAFLSILNSFGGELTKIRQK